MAVFNNILAGAAGSGGAAGDEITRSLRFNTADSSYLSRNVSSAGNRRTHTFSFWHKCVSSGQPVFFNQYTTATQRFTLQLTPKLQFLSYNSSNVLRRFLSNAQFRDHSAWYHFVVTLDTTNATADDRIKVWVNGERLTAETYDAPGLNEELFFNKSGNIEMMYYGGGPIYYSGYLADVHFIDGQALAATDFGEYDDNNVWQPKAYSGTYGTNGFHLDFSDNTNTNTIAEDSSGNNNDWTANNLSVTAGAGNDSLIDTPTNYEAGSGNNGGNYATLNPLAKSTDPNLVLKNGNLEFDATVANGNIGTAPSTIAFSSGKWYYEVQVLNSNIGFAGIAPANTNFGTNLRAGRDTAGHMYRFDGQIYRANSNSTTASYGPVVSVNDIIGCAINVDGNTIEWYVNGTGYGTKTIQSDTTWVAVVGDDNGFGKALLAVNFGQRPFAYTPPTGYVSLCTTNLPDPTIADGSTAMDVALYTGNGSTQSITGLGFQPDLVWIKTRSVANDHVLVDSVRGVGVRLFSNSTEAENTQSTSLTSFNSDGFSLGSHSSVNTNTVTHVAWSWDGGTSTVSNTDGSGLTSVNVRANQSAGFSIVSYTGSTGTGSFGHGLNAVPEFVIIKNREELQDWTIYHKSLTLGDYLKFTSDAAIDYPMFNDAHPNSSVVYVGNDDQVSKNGIDYIAYCFTPVEGYSAFGSYEGNGSTDGPFVYTGFRPRWLLLKRTDDTRSWQVIDTARSAYNVTDDRLFPDDPLAESSSSTFNLDILSNGFKCRTAHAATNLSGGTYIYAAFAENPFKTARAR